MSADAPFPAGACDTHIHVYDSRYPAAAGALLHPPDASPGDYEDFRRALGSTRAVIVQPTTYGLDNRCQLDAMTALSGETRGVMVVDRDVADAELVRLTALGVRGARFHMLPGGAVGWDALEVVARRVHDHGWHIQLQLNGRELADRLDGLAGLPCDLVVDHVGRFMPPVGVDDPSFVALRSLIEAGRCWVKLSAPYESSVLGPPDYPDVEPLAAALVAQAPERMLWASNWPHPGHGNPPGSEALTALLDDWAGSRDTTHRILVDNPAALYGF